MSPASPSSPHALFSLSSSSDDTRPLSFCFGLNGARGGKGVQPPTWEGEGCRDRLGTMGLISDVNGRQRGSPTVL
ncbi:hypothetical protein Taro_042039 [Colocasia esculenta]|uniref:Uncharacterized protein n=1 Tax=Colocasia esculenta TaxID=4460 RepID=A0A843WVC6_COLES|nr:hypothetical protein [Colocasia esculenta]